MGQRTIYVREEHEPLWEQAKALAHPGESLSALIAEGLRTVLAERARAGRFERIEATCWTQGLRIVRAFRGVYLVKPGDYADPEHGRWQVALTPQGHYVIWASGSEPKNLQAPWTEETHGFWWVGPDLTQAPPEVPRPLLHAATQRLQPEWLPTWDL
jgi:hypothetical protein